MLQHSCPIVSRSYDHVLFSAGRWALTLFCLHGRQVNIDRGVVTGSEFVLQVSISFFNTLIFTKSLRQRLCASIETAPWLLLHHLHYHHVRVLLLDEELLLCRHLLLRLHLLLEVVCSRVTDSRLVNIDYRWFLPRWVSWLGYRADERLWHEAIVLKGSCTRILGSVHIIRGHWGSSNLIWISFEQFMCFDFAVHWILLLVPSRYNAPRLQVFERLWQGARLVVFWDDPDEALRLW